jgi:predicted CoA-binding protein
VGADRDHSSVGTPAGRWLKHDMREFLAQRRIALVGLSRDPKDFRRMLFRDMCHRGYDMAPVNPAAGGLESRCCFGSRTGR